MVLGAAVLPPLLHAQEGAAVLGFGFSLYGMKTLAPAEALRACAEIGYDGVELALMPGWPTEPRLLSADNRRDLRQQLADRGLALMGLMENLAEPAEDAQHKANLERLKAAAELGHALSPRTPPLIETILGGKPAQWEQVKEKLAERLRAWAAVAATAKTIIAIKPHVGNALHTPEGALWLLKQVNSPSIRLAYDHSHYALRGLKLADTASALLPSSVFIHVKDAKGKPEKFEFLLPGDGDTDYADYLQRVKAAGYRGAIVVEVSGQIFNKAGYDPIAAARKCYANLTPAFQKAGVRRK
jgi:inosose dehydratase